MEEAKMIGREDLAAACRANDMAANILGAPGVLTGLGVEPDAALHTNEQRCLRAAASLVDGKKLRELQGVVELSRKALEALPWLGACWMDGFVCGALAVKWNSHPGRSHKGKPSEEGAAPGFLGNGNEV